MNLFGLDLKKLTPDSRELIAELLKTDVEALNAFEASYAKHALTQNKSENFFEINSRQAAEIHEGVSTDESPVLDNMITRIVNELINETQVWAYDGKQYVSVKMSADNNVEPVTNKEIKNIPENMRPELTGTLYKADIGEPAYIVLLQNYTMWKKEKNPKKKATFYNMFRQGLDILDIDPIAYEMLGMNPNSMGYWLPALADAVQNQEFFKIPKTRIIKVPLPMLQLTRLEYGILTRTTLDIVDKFCQKVFDLDETKDYFIKTGTYSSKFDFRNAKVHGAKEVRELGEYLLFIHHQASQMASPLNNKCIYGVSTTNEWVVREFIEDKENNPCIYKGLPLHTEYRVFVDFDTKKILGITPYWDSKVMKQRFGHEEDSNSPHMFHDYITYTAHEEILTKRYNEHVDDVKAHMTELINDVSGLTGQWSIDIMENGDDFWIIDMALAINSALKECIPAGLLKPVEENWIPTNLQKLLQ